MQMMEGGQWEEGASCAVRAPHVRFGITNMHNLSRLVIGCPCRCSNGVSQRILVTQAGRQAIGACVPGNKQGVSGLF
jgi:hypothetical protein